MEKTSVWSFKIDFCLLMVLEHNIICLILALFKYQGPKVYFFFCIILILLIYFVGSMSDVSDFFLTCKVMKSHTYFAMF